MSKRTKPVRFQPLTCIRQTGITRQQDGTTTYQFVAQINRDLAPVRITMTVTPLLAISTEARFDEQARTEIAAILEEIQPIQPRLLDAG
jgi:hypothetical protein